MIIKFAYGSEIHVLKANEPVTFATLQEFAFSAFKNLPPKYKFSYTDNEGDRIELEKDADVKILLESGLSKIKIQIYRQQQHDKPTELKATEKSQYKQKSNENNHQIKQKLVNEDKIKQYNLTRKENNPQVKPQIHQNARCSQCQTCPIFGIRYKCVICPSFDVCQECEAKTAHNHPFLKIIHVKQTPLNIYPIIDEEQKSFEVKR